MTRIGLISDTHGYMDENMLTYLGDCDEIWHAGDLGHLDILESMKRLKPLRAVYGNIDGADIRAQCSETLYWQCEGLSVLMMHIGGYPGKYTLQAKKALEKFRPGIFITGHSHILKVMEDRVWGCMHINPGAAGLQGWHKVRTMIRMSIDHGKLSQMEVIELVPRRAAKTTE